MPTLYDQFQIPPKDGATRFDLRKHLSEEKENQTETDKKIRNAMLKEIPEGLKKIFRCEQSFMRYWVFALGFSESSNLQEEYSKFYSFNTYLNEKPCQEEIEEDLVFILEETTHQNLQKNFIKLIDQIKINFDEPKTEILAQYAVIETLKTYECLDIFFASCLYFKCSFHDFLKKLTDFSWEKHRDTYPNQSDTDWGPYLLKLMLPALQSPPEQCEAKVTNPFSTDKMIAKMYDIHRASSEMLKPKNERLRSYSHGDLFKPPKLPIARPRRVSTDPVMCYALPEIKPKGVI